MRSTRREALRTKWYAACTFIAPVPRGCLLFDKALDRYLAEVPASKRQSHWPIPQTSADGGHPAILPVSFSLEVRCNFTSRQCFHAFRQHHYQPNQEAKQEYSAQGRGDGKHEGNHEDEDQSPPK